MRLIDTLARNYIRVGAVLFGAIMLYEGIKFADTLGGRLMLWTVTAVVMAVFIIGQKSIKKTLEEGER